MKLVYPAIFYSWEDRDGFTVEVPDLPGCVSEGRDLAEAIFMGTDAASGWVLDELEDGKPAPRASAISEVKAEEGGFVSMLALDIDAYAEKWGKNAVRKNVTIPAYLNTFAEKRAVNFSQVLSRELEKMYKGV
jgi:predicted RNase H-like HicB family nuclease